MAKESPRLPSELAFLEPVVSELNSISPEEMNEDVDPTSLIVAVQQHLAGLTPKRAKQQLKKECTALGKWLRGRGEEAAALFWIHGFISIAGADFLLSEEALGLPTPTQIVHADVPSSLRTERRQGSLDVFGENSVAVIDPWDEDAFEMNMKQMRRQAKTAPSTTRSVSDVEYGPVSGIKSVYRQTAPFFWKEVKFLLRVPGGHVSISIHGKPPKYSNDFDESTVEAFLHSLCVKAGQ